MKNISKQFVEWVTSFKQNEFEKASLKLAFWHSLGIFVVLTISSVLIVVLYSSAGTGIDRQLMTETEHNEISVYELREHLIQVVLIVDIITLLVGMIFSYLDARATLRPLKVMYKKQEQFMGDVAHELRTPLTVMKAGAESLLRQERDIKTYIGYLNDTKEEIDRMTSMVNNLLFLVKHKEKGMAEKSQVDIGEIIAKQVKAFLPYATINSVTIIPPKELSIFMHGTGDSLHRLVQNLLKNAIDYNVKGGTVTIILNKTAGQIILEIKDTGIGIDHEDKEKIFDRFYRVDESRTSSVHTGSGLGLSIVKNIVDEHKGKIDFSSKKGVGTTVTVTFPIS